MFKRCIGCHEIIYQDDLYYHKSFDEVRYPNDCARPIEYDGPFCPYCNNDIDDYICGSCLIQGNPDDEILIYEDYKLICHECKIRNIIKNRNNDNIKNIIITLLVDNFNFLEDNETEKYVDYLIDKHKD